jgi:hypothetical protein
MRPAFSSTRQAALFALLLLLLLTLPLLIKKDWLPPRDEIYAVQGYGIAPLPWIRQQIFQETNVIDIAFVGSSHMLHGIDTPYVQQELSKKLGRPAVVISVCWGGGGFDILYLIVQDLLQHRHAHLLVFCDEDGGKFRNPLIPVLFRYADNAGALDGLPIPDKAMFYLVSVMGMPRNLLMLLRHEIPAPLISSQPNAFETFFKAPNPALRLGTVASRCGFNPSLSYEDGFPYFVDFILPHNENAATNFLSYSSANQKDFHFANSTLPAWQVHFARQFATLSQTNSCQLVLLHLPVIDQMRSPVIFEREFWPQFISSPLVLAGVPEATLFAGLTDEEVKKLYFNPVHLNQNGQKYFTACITPGLIKIYEASTNH